MSWWRPKNVTAAEPFERRRRVLTRLAGRFAISSAAVDSVLIVVMGARTSTERSELQRATWCRPPAHCVLITDEEDESRLRIHDFRELLPLLEPNAARASLLTAQSPSPESCCKGAEDDKARRFFCSAHRMRTLRAQYRFLPALQWAKQQVSPRHQVAEHHPLADCPAPRRSLQHSSRGAAAARLYKWVALVDDDSHVFVDNLARLLSTLCPSLALYLGDMMVSKTDPTPQYACGGGGAIFSRAALDAMDVPECIQHSADRCQQSDWMVGHCARAYRVRFVGEYGCSCNAATTDEAIRSRLLNGSCAFFQFPNAPGHPSGPPKDLVPLIRQRGSSRGVARMAPAIVHQLARLA